MPTRIAVFAAFAALVALSLAPALAAAPRDVAGSKDYPGIGRFQGSVITGYVVKAFDATKIQTAAFKADKPTAEQRLEGQITRIAYRTGPGPSILEVSRNFETQFQKAGYTPLLACDDDACGGLAFSGALDTLPIPQMWLDGFTFRYYAGKKTEQNGRETYVTLVTSQNNDAITAQLVVAVVGEIENKIIDAAAMSKGLGESGHIALYGIYFDTNQAVVKPESKPTLEQIAALLKAQPTLKVVIVGHTDNVGTMDYNMDLSKRRAAAVAAQLASPAYGIPAARMTTAGVGYLAPVAPNASDDGRALNRRVELVQQ